MSLPLFDQGYYTAKSWKLPLLQDNEEYMLGWNSGASEEVGQSTTPPYSTIPFLPQ